MENVNRELIDSMREVLEFLEAHPAFLELWMGAGYFFYGFPANIAELRECARQLAPCKKEETSEWYGVRRCFGKVCTIDIAMPKSKTCERVVVGTRQVVTNKPIAFEEVVTEEEIVEWRCPKSLLDASEEEQHT